MSKEITKSVKQILKGYEAPAHDDEFYSAKDALRKAFPGHIIELDQKRKKTEAEITIDHSSLDKAVSVSA